MLKRCPQCGKQYEGEANFCPVDAGRLQEIPDDAPRDNDDHVLGGRFAVGDNIGGGLTGQVFKATDKQSGHPCVVKWVDPEVFSSPLQMQRTERELKQLERQESAGIARVLGHGRRDDRLWIASEYVAGTALDQVVASVGPLPFDRATKIVHDVGVALAEAAKLGVIHRDVAPKNVLVGDGDHVHVINFGVAVPATPSVRGLPGFVAPEQVDGKPVDQRSNIYSLGAMLYTIITGKPLFEGDAEAVHNAHLHSNPPAASDSVNVPPEVDKLLARALAKQSSKRFMTLRQLLAELEKVAGIEPASTQRMGAVKGKSKGKDRKREEASQTLLGVAAFEKPQAEAAPKVAASAPSGPIGLAPPVTEPPPVATSGPVSAESMPALTPSTNGASKSHTLRDLPPPAEAGAPAVSVSSDDHAATAGEIGATAADVAGEDEAATNEMRTLASREPQAIPALEDVSGQRPVHAPRPSEDRPTADARHSASQDASRTASETASGTASGKRRRKKKKKKTKKDKFRETMWFKKGELDEAAAEAAAAASATGLASAKADELPVEDRYKDDGSITDEDRDRLSLSTGHTSMMSAIDDRATGGTSSFSDEDIVDEMTGGATRLIIAGIAIVVIIALIIFFATR